MSSFVTKQQQQDVAAWFRSVCEVKVGDVTADLPGVLALDYEMSVADALRILEEVEIQSVAVYGPAHAFIGAGGVEVISENKQYIGIVSILDILAFSLKNDNYLEYKLSDTIGSTNESLTLWCEDTHKPLYFALEQFVKGVHHALVRDAKDLKMPLKYLAQTDILRFLLADTNALPHLQVLLVQPVHIMATKEVAYVSFSTPLNEAISLLVEYSALPVVNDAGVVISHLSASDFKGKSTTDLRATQGATVNDLLRHQAEDLMECHVPITISGSACLFDAARQMLENHIHRLWVTPPLTDSDNLSPSVDVRIDELGVISLTDILRAVYISEK